MFWEAAAEAAWLCLQCRPQGNNSPNAQTASGFVCACFVLAELGWTQSEPAWGCSPVIPTETILRCYCCSFESMKYVTWLFLLLQFSAKSVVQVE